MENGSDITNEVVVGFFRNGDDAHRAINELLDEGFRAGQIGAAFHSGRGGVGSSSDADSAKYGSGGTGSAGMKVRTNISPGTTGTGSGITGAASDTTAVSPHSLSPGAGTWEGGVGRPLPSGNTPHHPQYLHSEEAEKERREYEAGKPINEPFENRAVPLGSETRPAAASQSSGTGDFPSTGGLHPTSEQHTSANPGANWWDKLKHVFGGGEPAPGARLEDKTSMDFGTGEGHLGVTQTEYEYPYSGAAFENSFSGMGLQPEHSRRLARDLRSGGAIVSVSATGRVAEAERILERNNGAIRYEEPESRLPTSGDQYDEGERVQVFGEVQRVYPGYIGKSDASTRKAS